MNNIYVDELPKKCKDCPFSYIGYVYDFDEVRFCKLHKDHCMHWIALYNDKFNDCPLKLFKKALAEERKRVVCDIKEKLVDGTSCEILPTGDICISLDKINNVLDQIERGTDD